MTVLWSMIAAGALLLGLVHVSRGIFDRTARADLAFAVVAFCFVGVALAELGSMHAGTAEEWGAWVRWFQLPLFGLTVGTAAFIHAYLGPGRRWLLWSIVGLRAVILVVNFSVHPNFNFTEIASVARIPFLGEEVTVVGEAVTRPAQFLGLAASVLLAAFVLDTALTRWRRGSAEDRRRAVVIGGSVFLFVLIASVYSQLVAWRVTPLPILITPPFLIPLLAMSYELGRDMLNASRLARELLESHRRLDLAAGAAKVGLWEWDARTNRVWATRQAHEIFGLVQDQAADYTRWLERVHPDDTARLLREMARTLESGDDCTAEFRIRPGGGETLWILVRGRAQPGAPGRPARIRGVIRDISEQRRAQDETLELRRELAHAGRISLLGQVASSLAHELSQPLGAILRNAEAADLVLQSKVPDQDELKAIIADILRDDRRARDVVDRLRAMLKRRQNDYQLVAAGSLIHDVMELVHADAASRGVRLEHVASPGLPVVSGDRVQLSQVLLNLILNAMDAVAEQPAARRTVIVSARPSPDGQVELRVTDRGTGIPGPLMHKIFEPFYTTKSTGMGIGLAISRTIAEAHGGSLTAENDADGGATFVLTMPASAGGAA